MTLRALELAFGSGLLRPTTGRAQYGVCTLFADTVKACTTSCQNALGMRAQMAIALIATETGEVESQVSTLTNNKAFKAKSNQYFSLCQLNS